MWQATLTSRNHSADRSLKSLPPCRRPRQIFPGVDRSSPIPSAGEVASHRSPSFLAITFLLPPTCPDADRSSPIPFADAVPLGRALSILRVAQLLPPTCLAADRSSPIPSAPVGYPVLGGVVPSRF